MGDSLTFGYNVAPEQSYPSVLSRLLDTDVINAGVNGDTTALALVRLERDVLNKEPLLVIVILGSNDFLGGVPKEETFNNIGNIIKSVKSQGAMVALGQLGPFKMYTYKKDFAKLAKEENVLLIKDILSGIFGRPQFMSDNVHPNAQGYAKIAQKVYNIIEPILRKNRNLEGGLL